MCADFSLGFRAATQLSYDVRIKFPQRAIGTEKMQWLSQQGWRACTGEVGDNTWQELGAPTKTQPGILHEYIASLVKDSEYLVIMMRYVSADRRARIGPRR
jgi:hypothetical protein